MRFIRTESAVAAITEAIDFSAYNTSAGPKRPLGNVLLRSRVTVEVHRVRPQRDRWILRHSLTGLDDSS